MNESNKNKEIISNILKIENWSSFEDFIYSLYKNNNETISIENNYRNNGKSGRLREVDVLITFGYKPHIISLGIECKYWTDKVNADVVDVVKNKKDDLGIDKFVIITTNGYEKGAKQYAESEGIDIFVIRPINDDDFGYTGRIIKFIFQAFCSSIENINFAGELLSESSKSTENKNFAIARLQNMTLSTKDEELDPIFNLYRIEIISGENSLTQIKKNELVNNLATLINIERMKHTKNLYENKSFNFNHKIIFKSPTALFLENKIVLIVKEVNFAIRYFINIWKFEVDRGKYHPVVIENIIEKKITPLKKVINDNVDIFKMENSYEIKPVDLLNKPPDVIGREGVGGRLLISFPFSLKNRKSDDELYELKIIENKLKWINFE